MVTNINEFEKKANFAPMLNFANLTHKFITLELLQLWASKLL